MNETIFLGGCPVIRPEGIYYEGRRVISLGLRGVGLGDVGDLLAYRQEWEPFIAAHLGLWRYLNGLFESVPDTNCPPGIFTEAQIPSASPRKFCSDLALTRTRVSDANPGGILWQWNKWKDMSSSEIVDGAPAFLRWHQEIVMQVGGAYKDELLDLANRRNIRIELPDLPTFSAQQELIARIQGAYITTKGILQIFGYGVGETLGMAADVAQAAAQGLKETAKELPKTISWMGYILAATAVVVGGALVVYYMPRRSQAA